MVSIVTPTHEEPPLLEYTISNIINQTSGDWELVIIDNGKNHYFNLWLKNHNLPESILAKIKVIEIENEGPCIGKYKLIGIDHTSCSDDDFIVLLDHDDVIMPTLVENIINIQNQYPSYEMISSDCITGCWNGNIWSNGVFFLGGESTDYMHVHINNYFRNVALYFYSYVWSMKHPYHVSLQPKIVKKKAFTDNGIKLCEGAIDDLFYFDTLGMFLPEVHIDDIQLCYMAYIKDNNKCINSSCIGYPTDEDAGNKMHAIYNCIDNFLNSIQYKKNRIHYTPKQPIKPWFKLIEK